MTGRPYNSVIKGLRLEGCDEVGITNIYQHMSDTLEFDYVAKEDGWLASQSKCHDEYADQLSVPIPGLGPIIAVPQSVVRGESVCST